MSIFSYHLVKTSYFSALNIILFPPKHKEIKGLIHVETMTAMTLGSPIFSPSRMLIRQIAVFAQWENESDIDEFLNHHQICPKTSLIFMKTPRITISIFP